MSNNTDNRGCRTMARWVAGILFGFLFAAGFLLMLTDRGDTAAPTGNAATIRKAVTRDGLINPTTRTLPGSRDGNGGCVYADSQGGSSGGISAGSSGSIGLETVGQTQAWSMSVHLNPLDCTEIIEEGVPVRLHPLTPPGPGYSTAGSTATGVAAPPPGS